VTIRSGPILVVEDHEDTRLMMRDMIECLAGVPTVTASNGAEALDVLAASRPSLILLDLNMPVMNGWEFRLRQQGLEDHTLAAVPVVIVSALLDCDIHARELGAVDWLRKPEDLTRIIEVVRSHSCP
jgi:CheY-like chemotaxis protein